MSGYGTHRWTCGECGDSYEASGAMGYLDVDRWARQHEEKHRVDKLPEEERRRLYDAKFAAMASTRDRMGAPKQEQST